MAGDGKMAASKKMVKARRFLHMGRIYCKYCGGRLKRDKHGVYCQTPNCSGSIVGSGTQD